LRRYHFLALLAVLFGTIAIPAAQPCSAQDGLAADAELVETRTEIPKLKAPAEYKPDNNLIVVELSKYAGYSGLVVANGGLEPSNDSIFAKNYGFKVKLTLSEEESWSALNSGQMAASATTTDVLTAYGRQFRVIVPALIGFSRGADGVVVRKDIKSINGLRGKILAASQFTESDFFIRYLAQEAGFGVKMLDNLSQKPDAERLNLVFCADGFGAGDLFLRDVNSGRNRLAGCVTWAPKTTEVAEKSNGKAYVLADNKNILIVADILIVNRGFAQSHPDMVEGLVEGLLQGNRMVRDDADKYLAIIGKAFKWEPDEAKAELAKVHLSNLPENLSFFSGTMDSAGSYGFIYETASYVYGSQLLGKVPDAEEFLDLAALKKIERSGAFNDQKVVIAPIRSTLTGIERDPNDPLLSRDVNFQFAPNTGQLDLSIESNKQGLSLIAKRLQISPGSTILLRGHADGSNVEAHRKSGGESAVRNVLLVLKRLSRDRCAEVKRILCEQYKADESRLKTIGVGADEPTGRGPASDRRVEVQWFTV
jgi:NitT/TauT family transport system substrate-binding protein